MKGVRWKHTRWRTVWTIPGTPQLKRSPHPFTPSCRYDVTLSNCWSPGLKFHSPLLQDKDFKLLKPGDPIFKRFSGETVTYKGEALYPFFINECAYYEKKIAFVLGEKVKLTLPPISVQKD